MFGKYKIIVQARLSDGNSLTSSAEREGYGFKEEDLYRVLDGMNHRMLDVEEDILYYTIRITRAGKKDNFKLKSYEDTYKKVEELMISYDK